MATCFTSAAIIELSPASAVTAVAPEMSTGIASADAAKDLSSDANGPFPVDPASGDFWHTFTDVSVPGYGPGLDLTRTYNSLEASTKGIFGYGWTSSYEVSFNTSTDVISEADGSQITLTVSGSAYTVPGLADSTFVQNGSGTYSFDDQQSDTYQFSSTGQLESVTDNDGDTTTLTYNGSGQLTTVTDPSGRSLTLAYGTNGLVSSVTDPLSRETQYAYDSSGDLTSVTDPRGEVTSFTYDSSHLMGTLTFPNGQTGGPDAGKSVTNTYDSSGRVLTQTDQMGYETTYAYTGNNYSSTGGTTTITDPDGNVTVDDYTNGLLQSTTVGYGTSSAATWSYEYDPTSLGVTQTTDPDSDVTSATYDANGNVLTSTNALEETTSYAYNSFNEVTCKALPMASSGCASLSPPAAVTAGTATIAPPTAPPPPYVTYTEYDTDGNEIYQTTGAYPPGSDTPVSVRTTYDLYNGQSVTLGSSTFSCTASAPSTSLACVTIDPDGVVTQIGYDSYGDVTSKSTADQSLSQSPGTVSTLAGGPMGSVAANQLYQGNFAIALYTSGGDTYAYTADESEDVIRRLDLATGDETVVAGNYAAGGYGDGLPATTAQLSQPEGVAVDSAGDLAIADTDDAEVRFVPAASGTYFGQAMTAGDIYDIAGTGTNGDSANGGPATSASISYPSSVAFDGSGVVLVDSGNNEVRFVPDTSGTYFGQAMTAGDIYDVAGNGAAGASGDGGAAPSAELDQPSGVAVDANGDLAIADTDNNEVRFVPDTSGTYFGEAMTGGDIYTIAGNATNGYSGDGGVATSAEIDQPNGVTFDGSGDILIADTGNWVVRFVAKGSGTFYGDSMTADEIETIVGSGGWGNAASGTPSSSAGLSEVLDVAADASGDVFLTDYYDHETRFVPASSGTYFGVSMTAGDVYDVAGTGPNSAQSYDGPAADAEFADPLSIRTDSAGDIFIADTGDNAIRFIPKASGTYYGQSMTGGDVYDVAGDGSWGYSGDGGPATSAEITWPDGVAVDSDGDFAAVDAYNNVVRFVPATSGTFFDQSMTADDIYTIAGNGSAGDSGDGGVATSAELNSPGYVAFDPNGNLVIADTGNSVIRVVAAASGTFYGQAMTEGDIYTIAGNGSAGYSGDGGPAASAELNSPNSVTVDAAGDLLVADTGNAVVRLIPAASGTFYGQSMTAGDIYTIAGNGTSGYSGDDGPATSAELANVQDAVADSAGNVLVADAGNDYVRFIPATSGEFYGQAMTAGDIYSIAGEGWGDVHFSGDGGSPDHAEFGWILGIAPDGSGGFYLSDSVDQRIRYVADDVPTSTSTTTYAYDADGELTSETSPDGNAPGANAGNYTTTYTYDGDGNVLTVTQAGGSGATVTPRTTTYTYDGDGNQVTMTDARDNTYDYTYNADDEETLATNPLGNATLTCYNGDGYVDESVPAIGVATYSLDPVDCGFAKYGSHLASDATTIAYNALNEETVVSTPAPPGLTGYETTTYAYDLAGRLLTETAPPTSIATGAPDDVTTYTYDAASELLTTTAGYGTSSASTTSSCYDPDGDVTATIPGDGNASGVVACSTTAPYETSSSYQTGYTYDSLGELLTQTTPATSAAPSGAVTSYAYDPAGNELTETNPDGVVKTMTYTPLDQVAAVSYSDSTPDVTNTYDANGQLLRMHDGTGTTCNSYDPFGEMTSSTNGDGQTVSYGYDADGDTTSITYPLDGASWASSDSVTYTYDDADQMATVTDFNGETSDVTMSADGLPTALTLGTSGDTVSTAYGANDAPSSITLGDGSTLQSFSYSDGPAGNVLSETDTPTSSLTPADYGYNAQEQVTGDTPGSGSENSYAEDASGNLTTLPTGATATYNDASELTSSTLSGTTTDYTYDASGNRTGESVSGAATVTATYNGANELTSYDDSAADMTSATYNGNGLRMLSSITPAGGSADLDYFTWNTTASVPQLLIDSSNIYIYGPSREPFEEVNLSSGNSTFLVSDAIGSVRNAVNASGSIEAYANYDAWGNVEGASDLRSFAPFGFDGASLDETGLSYLINRYYDSNTGQFETVDSLLALTNEPYGFTNDNPVNAVDPSGNVYVGGEEWEGAYGDIGDPAADSPTPGGGGGSQQSDGTRSGTEEPDKSSQSSGGANKNNESSPKELTPEEALKAASETISNPAEFNPLILEDLTPQDVESVIPKDWERSPSRTGGGERFVDPNNNGRQIRIMPPNPTAAPGDVHADWYVEVSQNGYEERVPLKGGP